MTDENKDEAVVKEEKTEPAVKSEAETFSEEEVNKRIEAARKQEKDKLYGKIDDLEKVLRGMNDQAKAEQEAKDRAEAEAKTKAEAERQAQLSAEDRLAEHMRRIEEQLAEESAGRKLLETQLKQEREKQELEAYRQQVLNGETDIIPDLVQGNSKSDIDRSIAFAKNRYQELFKISREKAEGVVKNMPGPTDPGSAALDEQELQNSLQNFSIDMKRYKRDEKYRYEVDEKRSQILENVGSAYRRSIGR